MSYYLGSIRFYVRESSVKQNVDHLFDLMDEARNLGFYIAGIYREKVSGSVRVKPQLDRLMEELQNDDFILVDRFDRISHIPTDILQRFVNILRDKNAKLIIPGIVDLSDVAKKINDEKSKMFFDTIQDTLIKTSIQLSKDNFDVRKKTQQLAIAQDNKEGRLPGRKCDPYLYRNILCYHVFSDPPMSINATAKLANTTASTVTRVCRMYRAGELEHLNLSNFESQSVNNEQDNAKSINKLTDENQQGE